MIKMLMMNIKTFEHNYKWFLADCGEILWKSPGQEQFDTKESPCLNRSLLFHSSVWKDKLEKLEGKKNKHRAQPKVDFRYGC